MARQGLDASAGFLNAAWAWRIVRKFRENVMVVLSCNGLPCSIILTIQSNRLGQDPSRGPRQYMSQSGHHVLPHDNMGDILYRRRWHATCSCHILNRDEATIPPARSANYHGACCVRQHAPRHTKAYQLRCRPRFPFDDVRQ
jgi:hypothetical protein